MVWLLAFAGRDFVFLYLGMLQRDLSEFLDNITGE
jgi:hypothetical protein